MKISNDNIKAWAEKSNAVFSNAANHGSKRISTYVIDCAQLEDKFIHQNILDADNFSDMFSELKDIQNSPCVYFFEIASDVSPQIIVKNILKVEGKIKPSIKSRYPKDSNILYVGKVKSVLWGRIIMHLGFHTNKKSKELSMVHGLQLFHWATSLGLKLKLHVYEFEPEMADYMEVMERLFANELNPIIGRH